MACFQWCSIVVSSMWVMGPLAETAAEEESEGFE
ncbi:uncharacterized protein G2W53_039624 [Senna tora]|uniref:Uncharacterized protein n=1 Tax=Senna tora TaxID=362788 RepID=A0A834SQV4_9FABA|nr:uncharacterized protein G2W53_039624 [Senna tora]